MKTALTMTDSQKLNDHSHLLSYVKKFTSSHWGKTFVSDFAASGIIESSLKIIPKLKLESFNAKKMERTVSS